MKLLPKVHKLNETPSTDNFNTLTGRPIITAHSWITSNPSRLLGNELDNIILQLKELFKERDIPFPLIYNSTDLIHRLQKFNIDNLNNYNLTTFDFTSLYTNISYPDTINAIITSCKLLNLPTIYRDFLLNLNKFINDRNFFISGNRTYKQTKGVAMGSYHSRQIAGFHCHAIKIKIENHSMNEVKKLTRYRRYINKYFVQASGLCGIPYSSYLT